jgi:hypothetical protein
MKWLRLLKTVAPIAILVAQPELAPLVPKIMEGIESAEKLGKSKSGKEKLQHAKDIAVNSAEALGMKKPEELDAAITNAINTAVAVTNVVNANTQPGTK